MNIAEAIISRILIDKVVTLTQLETRATERGVSLSDLYTALDTVHRDRRVKRGVRGGEVYYEPTPPPRTPTDHLKWMRDNYPRMTPDNDGSGIDIDLSHLFMSPDEAKAYKAAAKGVPTFMYNKGHGRRS